MTADAQLTLAATIGPVPDRPVGAGLKILLTGVASDSHTWNLVFLQLVLEELGHRVVNLGPCVPPELLVRTCQSERPDLIVMSSVNGHGLSDGKRAVQAVRTAGELAGIPAVIGGKLGIAGLTDRGQLRQLLDAGFDAVFEDADGMQPLDAFLGRLGQQSTRSAVEAS
jgi:methylaspartate mutase sigma subunit